MRENLSFNIVESDAWKQVVQSLRPGTPLVRHSTMQNELDKAFLELKEEVETFLKVFHSLIFAFIMLQLLDHICPEGAPGKFSLTLDAWTSSNMHAFLGIMIHGIDSDWHQFGFLLTFRPLHGLHTSDNMAAVITEVLVDFDIVGRVCYPHQTAHSELLIYKNSSSYYVV